MSPIYPSMKVQMSEQRMMEVLDDYRLEKDKKEQVKLEHKTCIISHHRYNGTGESKLNCHSNCSW